MKRLALTSAVTALLLSACANDPNQSGFTAQNRDPVNNCTRERSTGSSIKRTRCGPARDDRERLRTMGSVDSIAGHARTSGGN